MPNETTLTVPFEHANIIASNYNGWMHSDADKDIAKWFASWYNEFDLVSVDWVTQTLKVKSHA